LEIKGTKKIPDKLKKDIKKNSKLRPHQYQDFVKNLDLLIDDDFNGLAYDEISNNIIEEIDD
jgi:hypothetical protein